MAAPTSLYGAYDNSDGTSYATSSLSPAANRVLFAIVRGRAASATVPKPTAGGSLGLTWAEVGDFLDDDAGATRSRCTIFAALTGGSPGSGTFSATFSSSITGCHLHVVSFDDLDMSSGAGGAVVGADSEATALSVDLEALADPDNYGFAVFGTQANETLGASDGTVLATSTGSTPTSALAVVYGVNNQTLAVTGTGGSPFALGLELKAASGVSGTSAVQGGGSVASAGVKAAAGASSVRGGGAAACSARKGGVASSSARGGGSVTATSRKGGVATSSSSGGGAVTCTGRKGGLATSFVQGGGFVTGTGAPSTGPPARSGASSVVGGGRVTGVGAKQGAGTSSSRGGGFVVTGTGRKSASSSSSSRGGGFVVTATSSARTSTSFVRGGGFVVTTGSTIQPAEPAITTRTRAGPASGRTFAAPTSGRSRAGTTTGRTSTMLEEG